MLEINPKKDSSKQFANVKERYILAISDCQHDVSRSSSLLPFLEGRDHV
jgi:hypothetical protein